MPEQPYKPRPVLDEERAPGVVDRASGFLADVHEVDVRKGNGLLRSRAAFFLQNAFVLAYWALLFFLPVRSGTEREGHPTRQLDVMRARVAARP